MRTLRYVAYCRVSKRRREPGYSIEAQRADILRHIEQHGGRLIAEQTEVISGLKSNRPAMTEALRICRIWRATLIVARLDRMSRNVMFITALMESGQEFVVVDFPYANKFTLHILAAVAEYESAQTSGRVKAALAAARARGVKIGQPKGSFPGRRPGDNSASVRARAANAAARARDLAPIVWELIAKGGSRKSIAREMDRLGIKSARGGPWGASSVDLILRKTRAEFACTPELLKAAALGPALVRSEQRMKELAPMLWQLRDQRMSLREICSELTRRGIRTRRQGRWHASVVSKLLAETEHTFRASSPQAITA